MPSAIGKFLGCLPAADCLKRLCARLPMAIFLLAFFTFLISPFAVYAATTTTIFLHPSGSAAGNAAGFAGGGAADVMDTNDGDASYAYIYGGDSEGGSVSDLYAEIDDPGGIPPSATIDSVAVKAIARIEFSTASTSIGLKTYGINYMSGFIGISTAYATVSGATYSANPYTGATWTWTEISNLAAVASASYNNGTYERITELYVTVTYTYTAPPDVTGFTVTNPAIGNQLNLAWTNPSIGDFVGVKIVRATGATAPASHCSSGTTVYTGAASSYNNTGLTDGTQYSYRICSYDSAGNHSSGVTASSTPTDATAPGNVTGFTVTNPATGNQLNLVWTNPSDGDFAGVTIVRATGATAPANCTSGTTVYTGAASSYNNTGLTDGTQYSYRICARDEVPNYSSGVEGNGTPTDTIAPGNVTGFTATDPTTGNQLNLAWTNPSDGDFAGVTIVRATGATAPANCTSGTMVYTGAGTSYNNTGLTDGTQYSYRICARDEVPNYSSGVEGNGTPTDTTAPGNVTGFSAALGNGQSQLSWTNPSGDFTGTKILRKTGGSPASCTDVTADIVYDGPAASHLDTPLTNGTTYYYMACAHDEVPNYATGATASVTPTLPSTISGIVYTDEGTIPVGAGITVRLLKKGVSAGTDVTDAAGAYSITAFINTADAVLVFMDDDVTYKGTTVSVSTGLDISGVNIYAGHVITRHDNAGSLTNANMASALGSYPDADIYYSVSGSALTVSSGTLYVPLGHGFSPGGSVTTPVMKSLGAFSGGTGTIDVNGALTVSNGTFNSTSGTMYVSGALTVSGGAFNHNSGTIVLDGGIKTVNTGTAVLYNVTVSMGATADLTVTGTMYAAGNFILSGVRYVLGGTIAVAGNLIFYDASWGGAGYLLNGTGTQIVGGTVPSDWGGTFICNGIDNEWSITCTSNGIMSSMYGPVTVNKPSGTVYLATDMWANSNLTITSGTLDLDEHRLVVGTLTVGANGTLKLMGTEPISRGALALNAGSTVIYDGTGNQSGLNPALGNTYSNLTFSGAGYWTLNSNLDVNKNLSIQNGTLDVSSLNYSVNVAGDFSRSGAGVFVPRNGVVTLDGANQNISGSTTFFRLAKTVSAADTLSFELGSTQTIDDTVTLRGAAGNLLMLRSSFSSSPPDVMPPSPVTNLVAESFDMKIRLDWTNPADSDFAGVRVLKKAGAYPNSCTDNIFAQVIYDSTGTTYIDTNVSNGVNYYYLVCAHDATLNYSSGITATAMALSNTAINLHPSGASAGVNGGFAGGGAANVMDTNDGGASYAYIYGGDAEGGVAGDLYAEIDDPIVPSTATIDSVAVRVIAAGSTISVGLNCGSTYMSGYLGLSASYTTVSTDTYYTNPCTGAAWTWAEISNLAAIVSPGYTNGAGYEVITELYVAVNYTRDVAPPAEVTGFTVTTPLLGNQLNLAWTNPVAGDFAGVKLVRAAGGTAPSDCTGQAIYRDTGAFFNDTGLATNQQYSYRICSYDTSYNYSAGATGSGTTTTDPPPAVPGPATRWNFNVKASALKSISYVDVQDSDASPSDSIHKPISPSNSMNSGNNISWFSNQVAVGSGSAVVDSTTQITASAAFSADADGDSTTKFEYNTVNSWPGTTACASVGGFSPRQCVITGLTPDTDYYIRITFTDADGVSGTNPFVIGPYLTTPGAPGKPGTPTFVSSTNEGLQAFWRMDEGSGMIASDASGNGNTGILSGSNVPNDDFTGNGTPPDSGKWNTFGSGTMNLQTNTLYAATATSGVSQSTGVSSKYPLIGDFDIQVDFSNLSFSAAGGAFTIDVVEGSNVVRIERRGGGWGDFILSESNYGGYSNATFAYTGATGKLRITRSGSTINAYYNVSGTWVLLKAYAGNTNNMTVRMFARNDNNNSAISGNFDNFLNNYAPAWTGGKLSNALLFDGVNDYVRMENSASLNINGAGSQVTIAAWIKPNTLSPTWQNIVYKGNSDSNCVDTGCSDRQYTMWLNTAGYIHFNSTSVNNIGVTQTATSTPSGIISTGQWYHVVGVVDSVAGVMEIYVNGVEQASAAYNTAGIRSGTGAFFVSHISAPFNGSVDELAIYNRALSAAEVSILHNGGSGSDPMARMDYVTWAAATAATSYRLERAPDAGGAPGTWGELAAGIAGIWYVDTGLACGNTYWYRVRGTNVIGNGPYSDSASRTMNCGLTVGAGSAVVESASRITASAAFTGDDDYDSTTGFEYNTADSWPGTTACASVATVSPRLCIITGLAANTDYYIRITHTDPDGVAGTNPQAIGPYHTMDTVPPSPVTNFVAEPFDLTIRLDWTNPSDSDFVGTRILRKTGGYPASCIDGGATVIYDSNGTNHNDTGLTNGTTYYYMACAYDGVPNYSTGVTAYATARSSTTVVFHPSGTSAGNTATFAGGGAADVMDTNDSDTSYAGISVGDLVDDTHLYAAIDDPTASLTDVLTIDSVVLKAIARKYTSFNVTHTISVGFNCGTPYMSGYFTLPSSYTTVSTDTYSTNPCTGAAWTWTGISNLVAIASPGGSDRGSRRITELYIIVNYTRDVVAPLEVTGFTVANPLLGNQLNLTWTNPTAGDFAGVKVVRAIGGVAPSDCTGPAIYRGAGVSFDDTGLVTDQPYSYRICAYDTSYNYSLGVVRSGTPTMDSTPPSNVTGFTAVHGGTEVSLSWTNPLVDFAGVKVVRRTDRYPDDSCADGVVVYNGAGSSHTDVDSISAVATYYYRACAYDGIPNYSIGATAMAAGSASVVSSATDFRATRIYTRGVTLAWSAPGYDSGSGTLAGYDVRFMDAWDYPYNISSTYLDTNWNSLRQASGEPSSPQSSGSPELFTLITDTAGTSLLPNTTYHFALKTTDDASNVSGISNVASIHTALKYGYNTVSLPYNIYYNITASDIFGDDVGGVTMYKWVSSGLDSAGLFSGTWTNVSATAFTNLSNGAGYYLYSTALNRYILDEKNSAGTTLLQENAANWMKIDLSQGRNLVGDPYLKNINFTNVKICRDSAFSSSTGCSGGTIKSFADAARAEWMDGVIGYYGNSTTYTYEYCNSMGCTAKMRPWWGQWVYLLRSGATYIMAVPKP